jgi:hypothetical protein
MTSANKRFAQKAIAVMVIVTLLYGVGRRTDRNDVCHWPCARGFYGVTSSAQTRKSSASSTFTSPPKQFFAMKIVVGMALRFRSDRER